MLDFGLYVPGYVRDKHIGGYVHIEDPDGPDIEYNTIQCCHCNRHVDKDPNHPQLQEMCRTCMAPICNDRPECGRCIPFEAKLEAAAGQRRFWKQLDLQFVGLR